jgi:hypothetical protein
VTDGLHLHILDKHSGMTNVKRDLKKTTHQYNHIRHTSDILRILSLCINVILKNYIFIILNYSLIFSVTYTRCCIDTIDSPDDEHWVARNM